MRRDEDVKIRPDSRTAGSCIPFTSTPVKCSEPGKAVTEQVKVPGGETLKLVSSSATVKFSAQ